MQLGNRWLVWSTDPAQDTRGGLAYDFKQYNAIYSVTPVAQPTGNGFLYSLAPTITPALTGTVSKVYDATTSAQLVAANFTPTSGVDGDVIALSGTGTYDNPNVAGSPTKLVTATGIAATVTSKVADGSKPVYGYTLTSTTANANIGEITPAPLTITGDTTSSLYTSNLQTNTFTTSGLLGSDSVTSVATLASGTNVGTYADTLTSATGTGLANYTIGYVNGSLTITPAPLTITPTMRNVRSTREPAVFRDLCGLRRRRDAGGAQWRPGVLDAGDHCLAGRHLPDHAVWPVFGQLHHHLSGWKTDDSRYSRCCAAVPARGDQPAGDRRAVHRSDHVARSPERPAIHLRRQARRQGREGRCQRRAGRRFRYPVAELTPYD